MWPVAAKRNVKSNGIYLCILLQNIIHSSGAVQDEMAHYLYVLQSVTLNHLEPRMRTPLDCYSQVSGHVIMSDKHPLVQLDIISTVKNMRMAGKWLVKCFYHKPCRLSSDFFFLYLKWSNMSAHRSSSCSLSAFLLPVAAVSPGTARHPSRPTPGSIRDRNREQSEPREKTLALRKGV